MASIISAGTSTGTALNLTGDTTGILQLASNSGTVGLTIDTSQNVGIGLSTMTAKFVVAGSTPYGSGSQATYPGTIQINESGNFTLQSTGGLEFKGSVFGAGYGAKIFGADNGILIFGNRANSATWTEAMRIDQGSNLLVGTTSNASSSRAIIYSAASQDYLTLDGATSSNAFMRLKYNGTGYGAIGFGSGVITGGANTDLGLSATAGNMLFATNGTTERMRITSSGNVLLRTTTQAVYDTNGGSDVSGYWNFQTASASDSSDKFIAGAGSGGIVGGTSNNTSGNAIINSYMRFQNISNTAGSETGNIVFYTKPSGNSASGQGAVLTLTPTGQMVLLSSTNGLLQQISAGVTGSVGSSNGVIVSTATGSGPYPYWSNALTSGQGLFGFGFNSSLIGSIFTVGSTSVVYNTTSDYRLKSNVTPIQNALATVEALNPVNFTWEDGRKDDGFLAHELQEIIPNCVTGEKDAVDKDGNPKYQQMDNSGVIPFLVKAIQEQQALITQLQADVAALKGAK